MKTTVLRTVIPGFCKSAPKMHRPVTRLVVTPATGAGPPGIHREVAAVRVPNHLFGVMGLNQAPAREGGPQDSLASSGLHLVDCGIVQADRWMKHHAQRWCCGGEGAPWPSS